MRRMLYVYTTLETKLYSSIVENFIIKLGKNIRYDLYVQTVVLRVKYLSLKILLLLTGQPFTHD